MNDLSLRLVRAFTTLARERQFRKAADKLHVSQSAFSQMIARLEAQVGARLVDRTSRTMRMTAQGALLLPLAEQLERHVDALFRKLREHADYREANIAITAIPALTAGWLPGIMSDFRAVSPQTRVLLFDTPQLEMRLQMLREGTVDFVIHPAAGQSDEFESQPLFEEQFFLVCAETHPLARRERLALKNLAGCNYIRLSPSGSVGTILHPLLDKVAINESGLALEYHPSIAGLIANGFGVSVVPGFSTLHYRRPGIAIVRLSDRALRRKFTVLKRRGDVPSHSAARLLEMIRSNPPGHAVRPAGRRRQSDEAREPPGSGAA